jgi:hypothetical protein
MSQSQDIEVLFEKKIHLIRVIFDGGSTRMLNAHCQIFDFHALDDFSDFFDLRYRSTNFVLH